MKWKRPDQKMHHFASVVLICFKGMTLAFVKLGAPGPEEGCMSIVSYAISREIGLCNGDYFLPAGEKSFVLNLRW